MSKKAVNATCIGRDTGETSRRFTRCLDTVAPRRPPPRDYHVSSQTPLDHKLLQCQRSVEQCSWRDQHSMTYPPRKEARADDDDAAEIELLEAQITSTKPEDEDLDAIRYA